MTAVSFDLGELVDIVMGQAPPGPACNKDGIGTVFVKAGEFQERFPQVREWTTQPLKMAAPNDTLVCVVGATAGKVNYSAFECAIGRSVAAVRPQQAKLDPLFLYQFLQTKVEQLRDRSQGAAQGVITREMLQSLRLLVPPLAEQRRIAAILDKADALRTKRREALAHLDRLAQSMFVEMFGEPVSNPKGWPRRTLKELGKVSTGGTPPSAKDGMFGGDIPFVTPGDLESGQPIKRWLTEAGAEEVGTVRTGAALVCCIGATIGKMGMAPTRSSFNQQLNAVEWRPELVDDRFGLAALRFFKVTIATLGASTTLPILKKSSFEKLSIPVPPRSLQVDFAKRLSQVEHLEQRQQMALQASAALFESLQQRAFQGEL